MAVMDDTTTLPGTLGGRVAYQRALLNMSQVEFAAALGLSRSTIDRIERDLHFPRADNLEKIAALTEVPVSWFFPSDDDFFT
jgi:transcriptional regulator with XRE-family HTH domain